MRHLLKDKYKVRKTFFVFEALEKLEGKSMLTLFYGE